jgi:hypothetical protein
MTAAILRNISNPVKHRWIEMKMRDHVMRENGSKNAISGSKEHHSRCKKKNEYKNRS